MRSRRRSKAMAHFSGGSYVPSAIARRTRSTRSIRIGSSVDAQASVSFMVLISKAASPRNHHGRVCVIGPVNTLGPCGSMNHLLCRRGGKMGSPTFVETWVILFVEDCLKQLTLRERLHQTR